jgi:hypothetical protein
MGEAAVSDVALVSGLLSVERVVLNALRKECGSAA